MNSMTEISQVLLFVACGYFADTSVFERFCVYSRKRIEMLVAVWTRIDRCISVDRVQIGNGNANVKKVLSR